MIPDKPFVKPLIISSTALLISLLLLVVLLITAPQSDEVPEQEVFEICSLSVADISAVAVKNLHDSYGFIIGNTGIIELLAEPEIPDANWSQDEMRAFIYIVSKLTAHQRIASYSSTDDFGLDEPTAVITILLKDGNKKKLFLGDQTPLNENYYLQKEGDEQIYVIGKVTGKLFNRTRTDYWNRQLLPEIGSSSINSLESIRLNTTDPEKQQKFSWEVQHKGDFSFRLTEPLPSTLKSDDLFSMLILPISSLYPERFVSASRDLSDFGLDSPSYSLEITHKKKHYTLHFSPVQKGKPHEGYYISLTDDPAVFHVSKEQVPFLDISYRELIGDFIYSGSIADVETITFNNPKTENSISLSLFGEGNSLYGIMNGKSYTYKEVNKSVQQLYTIGIIGEISHSESKNQLETALEREPTAIIHIKKRNGCTDVIEFFDKNSTESFIRFNGAVHFTVHSKNAEKLENDLKELENYKEKSDSN